MARLPVRERISSAKVDESSAPAAGYWHVRVSPVDLKADSHGRALLGEIHELGLSQIERVQSSVVYLLRGGLSDADVEIIARQLLTDAVVECCTFGATINYREPVDAAIEVQPLPGVMDTVAGSVQLAANRLLREKGRDASIDEVKTARRYEISGARSRQDLETIAWRLLANDCIEAAFIQGFGEADELPDRFPSAPVADMTVRHISLAGLSDEQLAAMSRSAHLFLSLAEMRAIRDHFAKLGRDPTDLELETLAQTWSEHCVHKTLKSEVEYEGAAFGGQGSIKHTFQNLLADTIAFATRTLDRDWCLSVFKDNAGVIAFDDEYGIAFKAETHNHPSAIEPYGGAATGVGGCIRDIMGCGLGAKPIASTDVFCLAPPSFPHERLPKDVLHPRRILKGVVGGVRDYGNRMGIPTVNGAIYFDERYLANPLVFCGCVGLIPRNRVDKAPRAGDWIVVAGGRTGRDGIHGATFSSAELTDSHAGEFSHAVQIGNAIEEKKVLDALLLARDHAGGCLFTAVTDCGAGGLSSAVGEMAEVLGADVQLEKVPLKYAGLRYDEIWISEAQERMVFAVSPDQLDAFLRVFAGEEVEAAVIGRFTGDGKLRVRYEDALVGQLDMKFLHEGLPRTRRTARWQPRDAVKPKAARSGEESLAQRLLSELGNLNVASKESVIRQYDHEVQGRSVVKPLVGVHSGPSDAAVLRPRLGSDRGIAIGCGLCPELTEEDPYWMAVAAVDEAIRNVICVGADPTRIALLDNFCWGKVETEQAMGELVRACKGAADAAIAFEAPFISGKDSLNNEYVQNAADARALGLPERLVIPGTLLISALGIVPDIRRCVTMDFKTPGNAIVLATAPVEKVGLQAARDLHRRVALQIAGGIVRSAHDVSDGGLLVCIAEMCIASRLGAAIELGQAGGMYPFARRSTTYVLELAPEDAATTGWPVIGMVQESPVLTVETKESGRIDVDVGELERAWKSPISSGGAGK